MPTLAEDLKKAAGTKIDNLEASAGEREKLKKQLVSLIGWKAEGLALFERAAIDTQDFAEEIEAHTAELHPWVTVYGAAMGMEAVWNRILFAWARSDPPQSVPRPPEVQELIDTLIPNYVMWIAS
jgi:hypothetical protein